MNILITCFSKTGHTRKLANLIGNELDRRGHAITYEILQPTVTYHWFREASRDFIRWPAIFLGLASNTWFRYYLRTYHQVDEDIEPLRYPDVSQFDRICIGGPKWTQLSFPIARYISTVKGLQNKPIGAFTTYCGPPLKIFEVDLIFIPMEYRIQAVGGHVAANVSISSHYHPLPPMTWLFRVVSYLRFFRSLKSFGFETPYAEAGVANFCDRLEAPTAQEQANTTTKRALAV